MCGRGVRDACPVCGYFGRMLDHTQLEKLERIFALLRGTVPPPCSWPGGARDLAPVFADKLGRIWLEERDQLTLVYDPSGYRPTRGAW